MFNDTSLLIVIIVSDELLGLLDVYDESNNNVAHTIFPTIHVIHIHIYNTINTCLKTNNILFNYYTILRYLINYLIIILYLDIYLIII